MKIAEQTEDRCTLFYAYTEIIPMDWKLPGQKLENTKTEVSRGCRYERVQYIADIT